MKKITITITEEQERVLNFIFQKEKDFEPQDPRDKALIEIMTQIKNECNENNKPIYCEED